MSNSSQKKLSIELEIYLSNPLKFVHRGVERSEAAERAIAISSLRRRLGVATVRAQCHSLLGRLEILGPGMATAANRRRQGQDQERRWRREDQAYSLAKRQGWSQYRTGFAKLD